MIANMLVPASKFPNVIEYLKYFRNPEIFIESLETAIFNSL